MRTISQLTWGHCRRCGRITRFGRSRIIRPYDRPSWRVRLWIRLHDFTHPYRCLEHPADPPSPISIEVNSLEQFLRPGPSPPQR